MAERSLPLLLAVHALVERREDRPLSGGAYVTWPYVLAVLQHLQPDANWSDSTVRKAYRTVKGQQSAIDAMIAGVQIPDLPTIVNTIIDKGAPPSGAPPIIPGVNQQRAPEGKKAPKPEPTEEELVEKVESDIKVEQAEARARINARLYNEAKKRAAFVATACDMLKDIVVAMPPAAWHPSQIPAVHIKREQEAVLLLSDIHVGEAIHADTMGALNVYNFDVFKEKARRLYAGVKESLEVLREHGNVRRLKILGLGDWVTGVNIFKGQAHHIEFGAMKQALYGAEELANLYHELLELPGIEEVDAEHVPGNHGRPGGKGQDPFEDNWDLVTYEFLRLRLQNQPRLKFKYHMSWWMKPSVMGWEFLCAHGDEVKGWNGIPNYGFRRWGAKWRELLDSVGQRYDYGIIGHHHVEVEEKNLIISGAWPGASFFSAKELQSGGGATQMFYSVS